MKATNKLEEPDEPAQDIDASATSADCSIDGSRVHPGGSGKRRRSCRSVKRRTKILTLKVREHGYVKARCTALDLFTGKKHEDLHPLPNDVMTFANKAECQCLNVDADSGEVQSLMENSEISRCPRLSRSVNPLKRTRSVRRKL